MAALTTGLGVSPWRRRRGLIVRLLAHGRVSMRLMALGMTHAAVKRR